MNHAPILEAEAVDKDFSQGDRRVRALAGVDLAVQPGEFVAVMGASGSGKSTLLHALAGLCSIDAGRITVEGRDLAAMQDRELTRFRRERIGLVFQAYNLIPTLTAEQNVRLPATGARAAVHERVATLLDRFGLGGRRHHKPDALSGGEQQRVAIARALVTEPAVLLADEPTGSLDSVTGQQICELLRRSCDEGMTVVMVTHEADVARWADRVLVLRDGVHVGAFACDPDAGEHAAAALGQRYRECLA